MNLCLQHFKYTFLLQHFLTLHVTHTHIFSTHQTYTNYIYFLLLLFCQNFRHILFKLKISKLITVIILAWGTHFTHKKVIIGEYSKEAVYKY
jgi:hypothetical protein